MPKSKNAKKLAKKPASKGLTSTEYKRRKNNNDTMRKILKKKASKKKK